MKTKTIRITFAALATGTVAFFSLGGPAAFARGIHQSVQTLKATQVWGQRLPPLEINDHHFGVGIEVYNPNLGPNYDRVIKYLDLGVVENQVEDEPPASAVAVVNGQVFPFIWNTDRELEVIIPASVFHVLSGNDATVTGFDASGRELAVFDLGGCYFL